MESPFFSIIVPTYQRPTSLANCLAALSRLDYPRNLFEVIIVNDGDRTLSPTLIAPYQPHLNIHLLFQTNAGPASARNTGARHAQGDFLAFTDDDCTVAPDWLSQLACAWQNHTSPQPKALGGLTLNALPNNLYAAASQLHSDAVCAYFNRDCQAATFFASCNFSVSRRTYWHVGGFDERFPIAAGEDRAFCDRWLQQGYAMTYLPAARVHHAHHLALTSFLKQHFNYGRGAFFFHQSRQKAIEQAIAAPVKTDLKFYWHLITYPLHPSAQNKISTARALHLCALFIACNLAKTLGFYWERSKDRFSTKAQNRFATERPDPVP